MFQDHCLHFLATLSRQEEEGYFKWDYLSSSMDQGDGFASSSFTMDGSCRRSMIAWMKTLVDFCNYSLDTFEKAVSCFDRYLATSQGRSALLQPEEFQLAVLTCLYTTVKVHERKALEPQSIAKLSRGVHTKENVEAMELRILQALQWRVNPPTSIAFGQLYIDLLPSECMGDEHQNQNRQHLVDLLQYQIYLAALDYDLSMQRPSLLAMAAFLNVLEIAAPSLLGWDTASILPWVQTNLGDLLPGYHPFGMLQLRESLLHEVVARDQDSHLRRELLQPRTTYPTAVLSPVPGYHRGSLCIDSSQQWEANAVEPRSAGGGMVRVVSYEDNMTTLAMEEDNVES